MNSLKNLKMEKVKSLPSDKEDVKKFRVALEQKTEKAFADFAKSKQKIQESANQMSGRYIMRSEWVIKL